MKRCVIFLSLLPSLLLAMEKVGTGCQLELCQGRKAYNQSQSQKTPLEKCPFCDEGTLEKNYILQKDNDVRTMLNKNPYLSSFDQGHHLIVMPRYHKEHVDDFSPEELAQQTKAAHDLSIKLYDGSYSQEYFTNWGKYAGQSVPHWHSQLKVYTQPPRSLPEMIALQSNPEIADIKEAFNLIKAKLDSSKAMPVVADDDVCNDECHCCSVRQEQHRDEGNLIIARFKHNFVCLSHYTRLPGEISVVPYRHVAAIRYLSKEEWRENMALSMALLSKMREYAHQHIRDCDGGNLYTKSLGSEMPAVDQNKYHVHTVVMPRTAVSLTPGFINGNSCKLDYDPSHLFAYLKSLRDELIVKTNKG